MTAPEPTSPPVGVSMSETEDERCGAERPCSHDAKVHREHEGGCCGLIVFGGNQIAGRCACKWVTPHV